MASGAEADAQRQAARKWHRKSDASERKLQQSDVGRLQEQNDKLAAKVKRARLAQKALKAKLNRLKASALKSGRKLVEACPPALEPGAPTQAPTLAVS